MIAGAAATAAFAIDGDKASKRFIRVAPPAPNFTKKERHSELAARRARVASMLEDNSVLILFSAPSKIYANDVDYHYRQENNLFYLTGLRKNGTTLVIEKKGGVVNEIVFVPKRNPLAETWNGRMYSNNDVAEISGIKNVLNARSPGALIEAARGGTIFAENGTSISTNGTIYLLNGDAREYPRATALAGQMSASRVRNALPIFARLRLVKSPYEIRIMRHSIDITNEALMRSMGMIGRAKWEYEVQAEVEYTFRRRNADFWGYPSIVGCGPNATTLHYIESQGRIEQNDLMLMDVGAEYDHYTADITRTFPVSGRFSKEQRDIYQIIFDAQEAAAAQLRPGSTVGSASTAARKVIVDGLYRLGLITDKGSTGQFRVWYMHGWGHWLGMNVHDVGDYRRKLEPGMIMTNEPGIYLRPDALENLPDSEEWREFKKAVGPAFEKYRGIGVRIEDDMLITENGVEWMSRGLPRTIEDVEAFMAGAKKEMDRYALRRSIVDPGFASRSTEREAMAFESFGSGVTTRSGLREDGTTRFVTSH